LITKEGEITEASLYFPGMKNNLMDTSLYFSDVPQVHILEEKYSVNYGNDITLYCTVNAVPDYTEVKWTKAKGGSVQTFCLKRVLILCISITHYNIRLP
jgi:hypothetical protein